ncbi:MAG: tetratricopeptide repeat protein [Candidatus Limnocylindria bacterium]|jgi:tetratricopeptide (TPR) repeat protein
MARLATILGRPIRVGAMLACIVLVVPSAGADAGPESGRPKGAEQKAKGSGLSQRVAEKLEKAVGLLETDRFDESLSIIDALAKRRRLRPPEIAQIHRFRGYLLVAQGNGEGAAPEFEKALAQRALDPFAEQQTTYSLAQLYTQLGKYDQALALIETWFAAEQDPKPDAWFLKAMILVQQQKFEAALEPARTAVDLRNDPPESWMQLLIAVYIELEDYPNVAANLERLISISPRKKQYWIQLAAVQAHLQQDEKALATLRLADKAQLLKDDRDFRQLSRMLFIRDLPYQCAQEIEAALSAGSMQANADSYRMLSNCYVAARENDLALAPLAKAGELAPDGEMFMLLGQMHLQQERYEPALEVLEKALAKAKPEQLGPVQLLIGVAQLGAKRFDAAERAFQAAANDAKVGDAARSYLKYVAEQRSRSQQLGFAPGSQTVAQQ